MNKRLFIAINIPNDLRERIFELFSSKLIKEGKKIVAKENIHLTLRFLGYFPEEKINELMKRLCLISFPCFEIKFNGLNDFKKRVLFVSLSQGQDNLRKLYVKLNEVLSLENEERFLGHATIARVNYWKNKNELNALKKLKFNESFTVKSFELMQSILSSKGPRYSIIKSFPLKE